jgi:hypothetical protein
VESTVNGYHRQDPSAPETLSANGAQSPADGTVRVEHYVRNA